MQKTKIILLRHADTRKDPSVNAALWELSKKGQKQAEEVANLPIMNEADVVFVSEEKKTALTAAPLTKKLGKEAIPLGFFNEVKRKDKFLAEEDFKAEKIKQLKDLNYRAFDGETGEEALTRFKRGVRRVLKENVNKTILIVSHGTILNIYFADLLAIRDKLPERWQKTNFCAYGVMEDGKVIKDIAS